MSYGQKQALKNVNLEIKESEFTCILGPPGAGKTTLLRAIAGLEPIDAGRILFDDTDVTNLPPNKRNVSMIFQNLALYPNLNVYDNIANPLKLAKLPKTEIDDKVKEVADLLRISGLLDRKTWQLSGGEMQRVAIARAFARKADAYLMDEPLVNLDFKIREDMRAECKRLCSVLNKTIVYATPDPIDAFSMADHLAVLLNGEINQTGDVDDIYRKPVNSRVGMYLGAPPMNIVDCDITRKNGGCYLEAAGFAMDVTKFHDLLDGIQGTIKLGIRPEHLVISEEKNGNISGKIFLEERIGSDIIVHVRAGNELIKVFAPHSANYSPGRTGQSINLSFDVNEIYLFSKDGDRLIKGI